MLDHAEGSTVGMRDGQTVLLVDDTQQLREVIAENLRDMGYTVLLASGGDGALRIAGAHEGAISFLLTDVLMPGMRGTELAARIVETHPEARTLFMSGSGLEASSGPKAIGAGGAFLEKPFTRAQLAQALLDLQRG